MNLRTLREESLPALIGEAAWRALRGVRKATLRMAKHDRPCPVRFHPIGYYRLEKEFVSLQSRKNILEYADAVLAGKFPFLGYGKPHLGHCPDWQSDWVSGKSWPLVPSARVQIVRHDGSDVKAPWELSRLQWAPMLAKAWVLTGDRRYRQLLQSLLTDWIVNNPVGMGVNWTIAMEAALRAISLCLTMELLWPFAQAEAPWLASLEKSLWLHLRFIEAHNEFSYLLRSNHYLSNIVGLVTLSAYLHGPGIKPRLKKYAHAVQQEILLQTYADGGDREASSGYHVFVAQLGLHSWVVQQRSGCALSPPFEGRLRLMFAWISTLADGKWRLPLLGDCDNGRVELLLDDIGQSHALQVGGLMGLASYLLHLSPTGHQQEAVWFGSQTADSADHRKLPPCSLLRDSGISVLRAGEATALFCAMPNGLGGKGSHHHGDKLSFTLSLASQEVFCDPGSRGYTRSAELRNLDRSTRVHNTISIDDAEQNTISLSPQLLFRVGNEASVSPIVELEGETSAARASHRGYTRYGIEHHRTLRLCDHSLHLLDQITGDPQGRHLLTLHFTLGPEWCVTAEKPEGKQVSCLITGPRQLTLSSESTSPMTVSITAVQISRAYGATLPGCSVNITTAAHLPATLRTTVRWH